MHTKTVTVLGAAGRIGRATVEALVARGAMVRAARHRHSHEAPGPASVTVDFRDADSVARAVDGSESVLVMCPIPPQSAAPMREAEATIASLSRGLEAAAPGAVVAISDFGAELADGTGITMVFHAMEQRLRELPCGLTFLRSAEHMHNWKRQVAATSRTGVLASMHHPVTKEFPTVHAPDVGLIAADLILAPPDDPARPRIVYAEGPRRYSALDVAAAMETAVGRPIAARELRRSAWEQALIDGGASEESAALIAQLYETHNAGRIEVVAGLEVRRGTTTLAQAFRAIL